MPCTSFREFFNTLLERIGAYFWPGYPPFAASRSLQDLDSQVRAVAWYCLYAQRPVIARIISSPQAAMLKRRRLDAADDVCTDIGEGPASEMSSKRATPPPLPLKSMYTAYASALGVSGGMVNSPLS